MRAVLLCLVCSALAGCATTSAPCPPLPKLAADAEPVAHMRLMAQLYQECARGRS